jgi:DNA-binding MarR family transcriptional regulator
MTDRRNLKPKMKPEPEVLRGLVQAFIHRFGLLDQAQTPCGMPIPLSDAHALMELLKTPNIDQISLAIKLGLSKSATTRLVQRLKRREQISRSRSESDGRAYNLKLTEKGKRQAEMINRESLSTFKTIISELEEDATDKLLKCLPCLIKALPQSHGNLKSR